MPRVEAGRRDGERSWLVPGGLRCSFVDLYFIGTFLVNGTVTFLLFAVVVVGMHYQILQEEAFLRGVHGDAYEAYCRETRRYLGRRAVGGAM